MGGAFKALGGVALAGLASAATGVVAIGKSAFSAYADYEQLVGGVETLFSNLDGTVSASSTVLENAANAYKTAGMSANAYMETVTSFSAALVAGLENDYQKAAEVSDMAITDMADNANKMGTSMDLIQNAYQGFAKQNYTMLDNLKLGYGGTKQEMERLLADAEKFSGVHYDINNLADVYEAIHVVQEELGIAGTTAEEASGTISGSTAAVKAAWENLVTGIADENADLDGLLNNFIDSIGTAADNILPRISTIVDGFGKLVSKIGEKAPEIISTLVQMISDNLPGLASSGLDIILALGRAIADNLPQLVSAAIDTIIEFGNYLVDNAGEVAHGAVEIMTSLGEALITNIPKLLIAVPQIAYELLTALLTEFKNMLGVTGDFLVDGIDTIGAEATYMAGLQGQNTGIAFGEGSVDGASGASGDVSGSWTGLISGAGSESEILAGYYGNTTGEAFDSGTVSGIQGSAGEVSGAARGTVTGAISSARGATGGARSVGVSIGTGMESGILSVAKRIASAAARVVSMALEAAKARADSHSPSRVFRDEVGKMLTLGIAEGMVSKDVLNALDKSAAELTGDTVKDLETMTKAWDAVYKNYYEGLEHQNFFLELTGDTDGIIANYRKMQETLHEQKEHYLRMGVDANDSAIRDMEEQWWDYQDKIEKVYSNNYSNLVSSLEHNLWLSEQQGGDPQTRIKILTKLMEQAHARADELRAQGYAEDSKEIMELQKDWWGWYHEIADINEDIADGIAKDSKDAFDGVISGLEHSLFLTEKNGGKSTEKIAILEKLMAETHKRADELREQGFDETSKEIMDLQKEWWGYHDELEGINDGIIKKFQEIADAAQEAYDKAFDAIMDKQKTMQDKLSGYGELYKSTTTTSGRTYVSLQDLDRQTKQLERYGEIIEELRSRGVSGSLMEDILGMGIDEGSEFGKRLLNMSEGGLNDYLASYQRKQDIAADIASRYYKPEFDALNGQNVELNVAEQRNLEYNEEQTSLLRRIAETFEDSGGQTVQVVVDGQVIANATFDDIVAVSKMRGLDIVNVKEG